MKNYDVIIIGGGASGFFAARAALSGGCRVLILDMGKEPLRKVLASGGGRCNFTNIATDASRYYGKNPKFIISALAQVKPKDILDWVTKHGLTAVEKAAGQYFCEQGAGAVASALIQDASRAQIVLGVKVVDVEKTADGFIVNTLEHCSYSGRAVILASGGISFPKLGVSDIGYKIAEKFGHKIVPLTPGLSALKTDVFSKNLAGVSLEVQIKSKKSTVKDSLLFTHFGIGGPAAYRASLFDLNADFHIDFLPDTDVFQLLKSAKDTDGAKQVVTVLSKKLPERFAKLMFDNDDVARKKIGDCKDTQLKELAHRINDFIIPGGTLRPRGFQSAEVTAGGVATDDISSKTFQSKLCPGLYFVGEVLDVTGDLGGFNLHFAFASGSVAGTDVARFANSDIHTVHA